MSLKAETENSTPRRGARERVDGVNPPRAGWEGPLERGQEMARRSPAVTGNEVRVSQTRIQVEPRTALFALSRYSRLRAF